MTDDLRTPSPDVLATPFRIPWDGPGTRMMSDIGQRFIVNDNV